MEKISRRQVGCNVNVGEEDDTRLNPWARNTSKRWIFWMEEVHFRSVPRRRPIFPSLVRIPMSKVTVTVKPNINVNIIALIVQVQRGIFWRDQVQKRLKDSAGRSSSEFWVRFQVNQKTRRSLAPSKSSVMLRTLVLFQSQTRRGKAQEVSLDYRFWWRNCNCSRNISKQSWI